MSSYKIGIDIESGSINDDVLLEFIRNDEIDVERRDITSPPLISGLDLRDGCIILRVNGDIDDVDEMPDDDDGDARSNSESARDVKFGFMGDLSSSQMSSM